MSLWGVNPSRNHYFLAGVGDTLRQKAQTKGIFQDFSTKLGLVYGAFFGFRVLHDARRYTRSGQVKDDVERTLRHWHLDGKILRFKRYSADKNTYKPGIFTPKKGGISANSSEAEHTAEARAATCRLVEEFGAYVRLPTAGEKTSCGLVWHGTEATQSKRSVKRKAIVTGPDVSDSPAPLRKERRVQL